MPGALNSTRPEAGVRKGPFLITASVISAGFAIYSVLKGVSPSRRTSFMSQTCFTAKDAVFATMNVLKT